MYKDYRAKSGKWYTFRPLPLLVREELTQRFNLFNKFTPISKQIVSSDLLEYNLINILKLYNLDINEFDLSEIDDLLINNIITVNYDQSEIKREVSVKDIKGNTGDNPENIMPKLISSIWGICDNIGDALYLIEKLPADMLINTIKNRSEDLERIYSSDKDKQKKAQKSIKQELLKKYEHS